MDFRKFYALGLSEMMRLITVI